MSRDPVNVTFTPEEIEKFDYNVRAMTGFGLIVSERARYLAVRQLVREETALVLAELQSYLADLGENHLELEREQIRLKRQAEPPAPGKLVMLPPSKKRRAPRVRARDARMVSADCKNTDDQVEDRSPSAYRKSDPPELPA